LSFARDFSGIFRRGRLAGRPWMPLSSRIPVLALLLLPCASPGRAAEMLTGFRPSAVHSDYGAVSEVAFSTGPVVLEPGVLVHHMPQAMKDFRFAEPVWVIAYETTISGAAGGPPRDNFLCHTFFGDQRVTQREDWDMRGIYSDAFTPSVEVPEGFGILLGPDDRIHWMPMFNNRSAQPARVEMKVRVTVIREKDLKKPLTRLYSTLQSVQVPHLYFVPPGRDEKQVGFSAPFDGEIHFLGTHVHPHGESIELFNETRGERVWKGGRKKSAPAGINDAMEVFSSREGYAVRAGEVYRITAVYNNPTPDPIDAMAGLFILYSRR
jgi:hypothetical protein